MSDTLQMQSARHPIAGALAIALPLQAGAVFSTQSSDEAAGDSTRKEQMAGLVQLKTFAHEYQHKKQRSVMNASFTRVTAHRLRSAHAGRRTFIPAVECMP